MKQVGYGQQMQAVTNEIDLAVYLMRLMTEINQLVDCFSTNTNAVLPLAMHSRDHLSRLYYRHKKISEKKSSPFKDGSVNECTG